MVVNGVTVHVNRETDESLDAPTGSCAAHAGEPFTLVLQGHDVPAHVHCRLDGDLDRIATLDQHHYYVEPDAKTEVPIAVGDVGREVDGTLELSTGYGAESVSIELSVSTGPTPVAIDEALGRPDRTEPTPTAVDRLADAVALDPGTLGLVALAALAVGLAASTAAVIGGTPAIVAFLVVTVGIVVAVALLIGLVD